jgi:hypothetical protein
MPRKPIGDRPLTAAERQHRQRERRDERERKLIAALECIQVAKTIREARDIAVSALELPQSNV